MPLTSDINLYFHTVAAEQISNQLIHDEGDRIRFAKRMFDAIQNGDIDAYDHRSGKLLSLPIGMQPLCVRVRNVNDWLKIEGYSTKWTPEKTNKEPPSMPIKQSPEERQIERWRLCEEMGFVMPTDSYAQYPRGIITVAKRLGISRQALTEDLNKYRSRRFL
jgi:hypothetical protein